MQLELRNIYKNFGEKEVLKGINFKCDSGKAFGLLGRNGAGKTTTIRILMNVFKSDSGEILLDGKPIDYKKIKIGYMPEERGLFPKKKVIEQLVYLATLKGMNKTDAVKEADKWLEKLEATEYRNKKLETLSKGNQQKIQLITALIHDPEIVILDEPFSGLDPVNALLLKSAISEAISRNKIVLFSSHQMAYVEEFCDSIAILNHGNTVLTGDLYDIKRNYPRNTLIIHTEHAKEILNSGKFNVQLNSETELKLTMDSADEKMDVMKNLTENYDIDEIKVFEPSLNDIFVQNTTV